MLQANPVNSMPFCRGKKKHTDSIIAAALSFPTNSIS